MDGLASKTGKCLKSCLVGDKGVLGRHGQGAHDTVEQGAVLKRGIPLLVFQESRRSATSHALRRLIYSQEGAGVASTDLSPCFTGWTPYGALRLPEEWRDECDCEGPLVLSISGDPEGKGNHSFHPGNAPTGRVAAVAGCVISAPLQGRTNPSTKRCPHHLCRSQGPTSW
jgi:hypothetical protein